MSTRWFSVFATTIALFVMTSALPAASGADRYPGTGPESAVHMPGVAKLRDCADILALKAQLQGEAKASEAVYRQFERWLKPARLLEFSANKQRPTNVSQARVHSLFLNEIAETVAMFPPNVLLQNEKFLPSLQKVKNAETMVSILDRCYLNQGWGAALDNQLSAAEKSMMSEIFNTQYDTSNAEIEGLKQRLSTELERVNAEKAAVCVLLRRQVKERPNRFPKTARSLLAESELQLYALRWLALSGENPPQPIIDTVERIASDESSLYELRTPALRAYGLRSKECGAFAKLWERLRQDPTIPADSLKKYFYQRYRLSQLMCKLRHLPNSQHPMFLVEQEFEQSSGIYPERLGMIFYPSEFFKGLLNALESHKGDFRGAKYQNELHDTARELVARGLMTKELEMRLKEDLRALPEYKLRPIVDAMGGTGDFGRFGLTLIKFYAEPDCPVRRGIVFQLMQMSPGEQDIIEFLQAQRRAPRYQDHQKTIDRIIDHIERARKRLQKIRMRYGRSR
jgi:hypothetical protein